MKRSGSLTFVLGVAAAVAGVSLLGGHVSPYRPAVAADVPASTDGVVVDGLGRTSGTPDVLRVTLGVTVRRGDVSSALSAANARQERVRDALRERGVAARDIQTSDVSVGPWYDGRGRPDGYQVTQTLTAKLRDLRRAGQAISDAVAAGGNEAVLQGVSFSLEDNTALLAAARDAAYAEARAKAERYARLAGRALGEVQLVAETSSPVQPLPYAYDAATSKAAGPVPISPGTAEVSVSVTVRWALR